MYIKVEEGIIIINESCFIDTLEELYDNNILKVILLSTLFKTIN